MSTNDKTLLRYRFSKLAYKLNAIPIKIRANISVQIEKLTVSFSKTKPIQENKNKDPRLELSDSKTTTKLQKSSQGISKLLLKGSDSKNFMAKGHMVSFKTTHLFLFYFNKTLLPMGWGQVTSRFLSCSRYEPFATDVYYKYLFLTASFLLYSHNITF